MNLEPEKFFKGLTIGLLLSILIFWGPLTWWFFIR